MPKVAQELGPLQVSRLTKPGFHAVGGVPGLYLQVWETGARSWILRLKIGSKRREMGLGGFPAVTLAQAREKAREKRQQVEEGTDPIEARRAAASALRASQTAAKTFEEVARAYIRTHESGWKNAKHGQQWVNTLEQHAFPVIGSMLVRDIEKAHVLQVIEPIWTKTNETASRLRNRMELILSYAMQAGFRPEGLNPARWKGNMDKLLASRSKIAKTVHHPAMPIKQVGAFVQQLRAVHTVGARALEFVILTAARSGEVRGAKWSEFHLDEALWIIPPERMKAGREHRVPLSAQAVRVLDSMPKIAGEDLVFASARGGALSDMTLTAILRRLKLPYVPHGFRSTFRDWAAEHTNYPRELAEAALAHIVGDKTEAAYQRGDKLEKRRHMMAAWAQFLDEANTPAAVVPIRSQTKGHRKKLVENIQKKEADFYKIHGVPERGADQL